MRVKKGDARQKIISKREELRVSIEEKSRGDESSKRGGE